MVNQILVDKLEVFMVNPNIDKICKNNSENGNTDYVDMSMPEGHTNDCILDFSDAVKENTLQRTSSKVQSKSDVDTSAKASTYPRTYMEKGGSKEAR